MFIIITASPNKDGLTAAGGEAAKAGIIGAGGQAEVFDISALKLEPCRICGNGWGNCRGAGKCVIDDCLPDIQAKIKDAEGVFLITPVYWAQPSERMKYFCDRLRRCRHKTDLQTVRLNVWRNLINGVVISAPYRRSASRLKRVIPMRSYGMARI